MTIALANWAAPSSINAKHMNMQADFLSGMVKEGEHNIGVLIMPQFTYHKGQLAMLEQTALSMLIQRKLSLDHKFALPFQEASVADQRDGRPLCYDGRVLVPSPLAKEYLWRDAPILKGRVEAAKQLAGKDMVQVVDVSETALPQSTDVEGTIRGAARWSQLGSDAYLKLLDGALQGLPPNTRKGILVVSLSVGVGHCFQAWVQKRVGMSVPFYYMGLCDDTVHLDWFMQEETNRLKLQHLDGLLKVPGFAPPTKEIPPDLVETGPHPPKMVQLVLDNSNPEEPTISVPKALVEAWGSHPQHGEEFTKWLEEFRERFQGHTKESQTSEPSTEATKEGGNQVQQTDTNKRTMAGAGLSRDQQGSTKKARTLRVEGKLVPVATATAGVVLFKAQLLGKGRAQSNLVIQPGHKVYLTNEGDKDLPFQAGYILAGFGRGKYRHNTQGEVNADQAFPFQLHSSGDQIIHGNTLTTVGEVVQAERKKNPECKVAYHEIKELVEASKVGSFGLQTTHPVCFVANGNTVQQEGGDQKDKEDTEGQGPLINRVAALIPKQCWQTHCTEVLWYTKWNSAGLTPIRPVVVIKADLVVPAGKALSL